MKTGSPTNYTETEADGTLVFAGDATVWDDQQVSINNVRVPAAASPTWTAYKGAYVLAFSAAADEIVYFTAQLTHRYLVGSDIEFHLHLAYPNGNAGVSRWNFTHSWASIGDTFPTETIVSTDITSPAEADNHQLAEIADPISGTGKSISSLLLCSLEREGSHDNDTYGSSVYLVALDFHIKMDTAGSRQETVK